MLRFFRRLFRRSGTRRIVSWSFVVDSAAAPVQAARLVLEFSDGERVAGVMSGEHLTDFASCAVAALRSIGDFHLLTAYHCLRPLHGDGWPGDPDEGLSEELEALRRSAGRQA